MGHNFNSDPISNIISLFISGKKEKVPHRFFSHTEVEALNANSSCAELQSPGFKFFLVARTVFFFSCLLIKHRMGSLLVAVFSLFALCCFPPSVLGLVFQQTFNSHNPKKHTDRFRSVFWSHHHFWLSPREKNLNLTDNFFQRSWAPRAVSQRGTFCSLKRRAVAPGACSITQILRAACSEDAR